MLLGVRFIHAFGHNTFINRSIYNLVLCVSLFKDIFNRYTLDSLTLNSQLTRMFLKPDWSFPNTYSLRKACHSRLFLRNASTSALCLAAILNRKIINKSTKSVKKGPLNIPQKGHLFIVQALKQQGRVLPCLTSAGSMGVRASDVLASLSMSVNDPHSAMGVDLGGYKF